MESVESALDKIYRYFTYATFVYFAWLFYGLWRFNRTPEPKVAKTPQIQVIPPTPSTPDKNFGPAGSTLFTVEAKREVVKKVEQPQPVVDFKLESPTRRKQQRENADSAKSTSAVNLTDDSAGGKCTETPEPLAPPTTRTFETESVSSDLNDLNPQISVKGESPKAGGDPLLAQILCDINRVDDCEQLRLETSFDNCEIIPYHEHQQSAGGSSAMIEIKQDGIRVVRFADPLTEVNVFDVEDDSSFDKGEDEPSQETEEECQDDLDDPRDVDTDESDENSETSRMSSSPDSSFESNSEISQESILNTTTEEVVEALLFPQIYVRNVHAGNLSPDYDLVYKEKLERLSIGDYSWSDRSSPIPFSPTELSSSIRAPNEPPISPDRGYDSFTESPIGVSDVEDLPLSEDTHDQSDGNDKQITKDILEAPIAKESTSSESLTEQSNLVTVRL